MESVKHKMEDLVNRKEEALAIAIGFENAMSSLADKKSKLDADITKAERQINVFEEQLDSTVTKTLNDCERLEIADRTATDAELEVSALVRRVQLLEEETVRVNERLVDVLQRLTTVEQSCESNERTRKVLEATSFQNEEKMELQECQLVEARTIAEEAAHKYDEVVRKLNMVEQEHERVNDKGDEFETKAASFDIQLQENLQRLKKLEDITYKNSEKEDYFEEEVRRLREDLKNQETRAEFGERTVEKLESSIDAIQDSLLREKESFNSMSKKLDQTLTDMMKVGCDI